MLLVRAAAARTFWMAGSKRPMSTAMMAITTKSSISVKAGRDVREAFMGTPRENKDGTGRVPSTRTAPGRPTPKTRQFVLLAGDGSVRGGCSSSDSFGERVPARERRQVRAGDGWGGRTQLQRTPAADRRPRRAFLRRPARPGFTPI